jgi:hypothetical protein
MICTTKRNSASNWRKIPAVASSVVIKKTALCTALRRVIMTIAETTANAAKK